jgi:hypothetical protein
MVFAQLLHDPDFAAPPITWQSIAITGRTEKGMGGEWNDYASIQGNVQAGKD